ncbi:MAG TPA: BrnT family toxin [Porphyromonadaceae bacterium]|nr:BrnT family toxin [Porphyromonadaceae bacterium]
MYEFDGFDWDQEKRKLILEIRALDISKDGLQVVSDPMAITAKSPQKGEERYKTTGMRRGKLYTVIHTPRNGKCRIITMRRAHKDEEEAYNEYNRT